MQIQTMRCDSLLLTTLTGLSFTARNTSSTLYSKINVTLDEEGCENFCVNPFHWPWRSTSCVMTNVVFDVYPAATFDYILHTSLPTTDHPTFDLI